MDKLERNKSNVKAFYDLMFNQCRPREAIEGYAGAEGDHVVLHCHPRWTGDHDYAGIDIFRLDADGRIVEHWDVLQVVPSEAKNANGMF